jgi:hypothetical protein
MSNEIDVLSAGEIQPYDAGMPVLAPLSPNPDTWGRTDVLTNREIDEYQRQPQGPTLFGAALPAGTTPQQVEQTLIQLGAVFANDMGSLGYPASYINATVQFYQTHAAKKPYAVTKNHNFTLPTIADDCYGHAFANMVQTLSGSPRAKQQWITSALTWLAKVNQKLNSGVASLPAQGSAPSSTPLADLSKEQFAQVQVINKQAQQRTLQTLQAKHGEFTAMNMIALAQDHLNKLTPREQEHFEQLTTGGVVMYNTVEAVEFLYGQSIGAASLPNNGAAITQELKQFETMLADPVGRKKYFKDPQLQARYRTLLDMKDGS